MLERAHGWVDAVARAPGIRAWLDARDARRFASNRSDNLFRGVFASFEEANASAPPGLPRGYDSDAAALMYRDRLRRLFPTDYPVLFWLQGLLAQGAATIFDLGGHIGLSYYAWEDALPLPSRVRWTVCDVPAVVARGQAYARHHDSRGHLAFTSNFADADGADVLLAMGVLQYLPDTLAERLGALRVKPRSILVNLTPLHSGRRYFTLQSIGTAYCPYRIESEPDFLRDMHALGYSPRDTWINPDKACLIPWHPDESIRFYRGFHFARIA